jgi:TonB family protein
MQPGAMIQANQPGVEPPELVQFPSFGYPAAARGSGSKVNVEVAVLVDETGKVLSAEVRTGGKSPPAFEEAALEAARRARFHPARRDGIPGKMWTELLFEFAE